MLGILSSVDFLVNGGTIDNGVAAVLIAARQAGHPVAFVSNHGKPPWFDSVFPASTGVQFLLSTGRQNGKIVSENAARLNLKPYNFLVLAATITDVQMSTNGGAVLVSAGWAADQKISDLGVCVSNAAELQTVISMTAQWSGSWWFNGTCPKYKVLALANLSTHFQSVSQTQFGQKVRVAVKNGSPTLQPLLAVAARSLLIDGVASVGNLMWGVYPSAASQNNDTEVLSDFCHRLRTTVSRVRFCTRGDPLFIRHTPSIKRSAMTATNRTNPTDQILTMHLNPTYEGKITGRNVILLDDCATYGLSFGVAAAFLKKAGAKTVTGVALGKFGNTLNHFDIRIDSNPFQPIPVNGFKTGTLASLQGTNDPTAQALLTQLIP